jgi:ABC-type dipeptide/oligopeptide/nickel transport system ATPase subunit
LQNKQQNDKPYKLSTAHSDELKKESQKRKEEKTKGLNKSEIEEILFGKTEPANEKEKLRDKIKTIFNKNIKSHDIPREELREIVMEALDSIYENQEEKTDDNET